MEINSLPQRFLDKMANAECRMDDALLSCAEARTLTEMKRSLQRFNLASENYMTVTESAIEEMERRLYSEK